ncbi:RNA polymerase sigma factor RpoD/SigA [Pedobacter sp. P351]|uniref:sigma-70 family RNA polymerase sigma factor n=1 Tax=Pedobacter superstes TaxID=3133441 RepID=UPI00309CEDE5
MEHKKIAYSITNRDDSSLKRYLNDIGKINTITAEEEILLVKQIGNGNQAALERLVTANLRFVVSIAKQYQNSHVELCDLINEGNIGLIKAAKRFDAGQGFKFLSYAVWWIRQSIINSISEYSSIVHLPQNQSDALSRIKKASAKLEQQLEREPSIDELAFYLNVNAEKISDSLLNSGNYSSLYNPVSSSNENTLMDILPDDAYPTDNGLLQESLSKDVQRYISVLPVKECEVLKLYYGIDNPGPLTLEEISDKFSLSRERIRQLKEKAIQRLQASSQSVSFLWSA